MLLEIFLVDIWHDISESVSNKAFFNYFGLDDGFSMHFPYLRFKNKIGCSFILDTAGLGETTMATTVFHKAALIITYS